VTLPLKKKMTCLSLFFHVPLLSTRCFLGLLYVLTLLCCLTFWLACPSFRGVSFLPSFSSLFCSTVRFLLNALYVNCTKNVFFSCSLCWVLLSFIFFFYDGAGLQQTGENDSWEGSWGAKMYLLGLLLLCYVYFFLAFYGGTSLFFIFTASLSACIFPFRFSVRSYPPLRVSRCGRRCICVKDATDVC
jgi:hypothetical protein